MVVRPGKLGRTYNHEVLKMTTSVLLDGRKEAIAAVLALDVLVVAPVVVVFDHVGGAGAELTASANRNGDDDTPVDPGNHR